jgi:prophage tail gpP-like protein
MSVCDIFVGGGILENWTTMTLSRSKSEMTGTLNVTVFMSYIPGSPVITQVAAGKPIQCYIGGQLALNGVIDSRTGNGSSESYNVTISARGKTKKLIDSCHGKTKMMLKPTNREVMDELVKGTGIELDWKAETHKLEKVRFRSNTRIHEEMFRIGTENAHFMYETRDGKMRVTDDTGRKAGHPLVLGVNILSFSCEQSEHEGKSEVTVKGKRTDKTVRGKKACDPTVKQVKDASVKSKSPMIVHHYGDGTDEALKRRAKFEADKRNATTKNIKIDVFHVQTPSGEPWDVGLIHQVSIPPEGVAGPFECTAIEYSINSDKQIQTSLTLSPPPKAASGGGAGAGLAGITVAVSALIDAGSKKKTQTSDNYPQPWEGADISDVVVDATAAVVEEIASGLSATLTSFADNPPLTISIKT